MFSGGGVWCGGDCAGGNSNPRLQCNALSASLFCIFSLKKKAHRKNDLFVSICALQHSGHCIYDDLPPGDLIAWFLEDNPGDGHCFFHGILRGGFPTKDVSKDKSTTYKPPIVFHKNQLQTTLDTYNLNYHN